MENKNQKKINEKLIRDIYTHNQLILTEWLKLYDEVKECE